MALLRVLRGNANLKLGKEVCENLGVSESSVAVSKFMNGETSATIQCSVRGADVYVINSGIGEIDANDAVMELLIMVNACKIASAHRVIAVLPYYPYAKQSKMKKRGAIPARLVASMLHVAGASHVITIDLTPSQMAGFFDVPLDNIQVLQLLQQYITEKIPDYQSAVIVAKNAGASKRATQLAKMCKIDVALVVGKEEPDGSAETEEYGDDDSDAPPPSPVRPVGTSSTTTTTPTPTTPSTTTTPSTSTDTDATATPSTSSTAPTTPSPLTPTTTQVTTPTTLRRPSSRTSVFKTPTPFRSGSVIGNVAKSLCIIVDDVIDGASSFIAAAEACMKQGAKRVIVVCTHGILSGNSLDAIERSCISEVVVTDTIQQTEKQKRCSKLRVISTGDILAEAIRRVHNNESIQTITTQQLGLA